MFAKSVSEPEEDGSELNEGEEGGREFFVASGDAAVAFDRSEKVFDAVPPAIEPGAEGAFATATAAAGDGAGAARYSHAGAQAVGVEALVCDQGAAAQKADMRLDRVNVAVLPAVQTQRDRPAVTIDQGGQLGVKPAFGPAHGLRRLTSLRVRSVLMQLDVRGVCKTGSAAGE